VSKQIDRGDIEVKRLPKDMVSIRTVSSLMIMKKENAWKLLTALQEVLT
jgi:hypothetical protein